MITIKTSGCYLSLQDNESYYLQILEGITVDEFGCAVDDPNIWDIYIYYGENNKHHKIIFSGKKETTRKVFDMLTDALDNRRDVSKNGLTVKFK